MLIQIERNLLRLPHKATQKHRQKRILQRHTGKRLSHLLIIGELLDIELLPSRDICQQAVTVSAQDMSHDSNKQKDLNGIHYYTALYERLFI